MTPAAFCFADVVRWLLDGHQVNRENIPDDVAEFNVLEKLGYTLGELLVEQNCSVNRWMTIVGERNAWERRQAET